MLQLDYIDVGPRQSGEKYVLMILNDNSTHSWLFEFSDTAAEHAALTIIE